LVVGKYVVDWLKNQTELAHIHLQLGYKAFSSPRWKLIAHPYPVYFENHESLVSAIVPSNVLFALTARDDKELVSKIGEPSYVLVKFILMTAPKLISVPMEGPCKMLAVPNVAETKTYIFHGSGEENWFSIIRNGLKSCSGTAWQKNGAAHGKGIYMGKTIETSIGYCGYSGPQILAVYKWKDKAIETGTIMVLKDASDIELQYIVIADKLTDCKVEIMEKIKHNIYLSPESSSI